MPDITVSPRTKHTATKAAFIEAHRVHVEIFLFKDKHEHIFTVQGILNGGKNSFTAHDQPIYETRSRWTT